jgi:hypothetical protein
MHIIINKNSEISEYKGSLIPTQSVKKEVCRLIEKRKIVKESEDEKKIVYKLKISPRVFDSNRILKIEKGFERKAYEIYCKRRFSALGLQKYPEFEKMPRGYVGEFIMIDIFRTELKENGILSKEI